MSTTGRRLTLATLWLILPIAGAVIAATLEPMPPHDYWWHLAMGRIVGAGHLPDSNLFLYTLSIDQPFVNQPWLGQWVMWLVHDHFGAGGTVLLRNVLLVGAFAFIIATAWSRCRDARAVGALGLLAAVLAYPVLTVRTRMFAFLPFAAVVWVCAGVTDGRLRRRWLAVPALATVLWANTHGSFVLAIALVGACGLGVVVQDLLEGHGFDLAQVRDWGLALTAVVLAGAVTPLGFGVYAYVLQLTVESSVAHSVSEWRPPDVGELRGQLFAVSVLGTLVLLAWRRSSVRLSDALMFAGTLVLAAGAIRSMFWWAALVPIVVAPQLAALLPARTSDDPGPLERAGLAVALLSVAALVLSVQPGVARRAIGAQIQSGQALQSGEGAWLLNHENALAATQRLRADARRRVFHDQALGGLLEYQLATTEKTQVAFVDQRMEFVPEATWKRYFAISSAAEGWDEELAELGVDTLLLTPDAQWPLVQAALAMETWSLVFVDQSHLLFYRSSLDGLEHPAKQQ